MDNHEFKRTEKLLYDYFEQPPVIESLQHRVSMLEEQVKEIEHDISTTNIHLEPCLNMGIDYSRDKIQTSSQGSYAENEACRQIGILIKEKNDTIAEINSLKMKIRAAKKNNQIIHDNLVSLSEENKDFIRLKYQQKVPYPQIFDDTHLSKSAWFDKRNKLIEKIADWFRFVGKS